MIENLNDIIASKYSMNIIHLIFFLIPFPVISHLLFFNKIIFFLHALYKWIFMSLCNALDHIERDKSFIIKLEKSEKKGSKR